MFLIIKLRLTYVLVMNSICESKKEIAETELETLLVAGRRERVCVQNASAGQESKHWGVLCLYLDTTSFWPLNNKCKKMFEICVC